MINSDDIKGLNEAKLIAFTGPAGCGKSTAAQILLSKGWKRVKFASVLKDMCRAMGLTDSQIEGDLKEQPIPNLGVSPRWIMQSLGTNWGRELIHPDLWVNMTHYKVFDLLEGGHNVVIDDCRFDNESNMVRNLGGKVVKINGRSSLNDAHVSESGCSYDFVIDNNGTLEDLEKAVDDLVITL